jgi:hypothetical protein
MFRLEDLRRVGWTQLFGGMVTLIVGIIAQIAIGFNLTPVVTQNFIYYILFSIGWFLFSQFVMASIYKRLLPEQKRAKLTQLSAPVTTPPVGRFGMAFQYTEIIYLVAWVVGLVAVILLAGQNLTLPIGGFVAAWLVGGGIGRLRFSSKVKQEEEEQGVKFYFSDSLLGPSTSAAFYSPKPEDQPVATPAGWVATNLPPGIKRRASTPQGTKTGK